jgi:hypothetical protein
VGWGWRGGVGDVEVGVGGHGQFVQALALGGVWGERCGC